MLSLNSKSVSNGLVEVESGAVVLTDRPLDGVKLKQKVVYTGVVHIPLTYTTGYKTARLAKEADSIKALWSKKCTERVGFEPTLESPLK